MIKKKEQFTTKQQLETNNAYTNYTACYSKMTRESDEKLNISMH